MEMRSQKPMPFLESAYKSYLKHIVVPKERTFIFILLTSVIYGLFELLTKLPKIFNE